jgi:myosin-crossreactive antigen
MNIIRKVILFIKNIYAKQDEVKKLAEPRIIVKEDKKESFIESLKITTTQKRTKKRVETLTCNGDGLGIQKKITC